MSATPVDTIAIKEAVSPVSTITNVEKKKKAVGRKKGCKLDLESLESGGHGGKKIKDENLWNFFRNMMMIVMIAVFHPQTQILHTL